MRLRGSLLALAGLLLATTGIATCAPPGGLGGPDSAATAPALPAITPLERPLTFETDVKPVLESRCVACHGCYDAPCQLLLSSSDGIARGASKEALYDTTRLFRMKPTRLGIDAHTTAQWRAKDFFSVLGDAEAGAAKRSSSAVEPPASDALLLRMLALGRANPFPPERRIPESVGLDINRKLSCTSPDEFGAYVREHPQGGMPYAMAPLPDHELRVLASWVQQGAPLSKTVQPLPARAREQLAVWEDFLNGRSLKERIVARYLYEHWFVAHLYFDDLPAGPFFRVVRSRTPQGEAIGEISTLRPYDDPEGPVFYRLQPIESTILHKTHIVYPLSTARMARLRELFLGADWSPTRFPSYAADEASNPFVAFDQIPARSRYQFLLDDAQYFVMTFIRGPVCRGQVAVDVIEDQFWVAFLDPDRDLSVTSPAYLERTKSFLSLPAEHAGTSLPGELWLEYNLKQRKYLDERERFYDEADPERRGPALDWVWDGDGRNRNALLTVIRNFDNASVVKGFLGEIPKTAWIMDYPIFERIYYNLVAGYDVFGAVGHQLATRLYMDHLRMQSENLFLQFLPSDRREQIRASWYVGATRQVDYFLADRLHGMDHGTQVRLRVKDVKAELLEQILGRSPAVAGPPDTINRCAAPPCDRAEATAAERAVERELRKLGSVRGAWVARMPEVALLRVRLDDTGERDLVYSLVHNDAHTNVAFMFGEDERRLPEQDTLSVIRGQFGSYPNFFFEVRMAEVAEFVGALTQVSSDSELSGLVESFGVRRTSSRIWETLDWLQQDFRKQSVTEAGLYDLGRYGNP